MIIQDVVRSQYMAAVEMLRQAVARCPDSLWDAPEYRNRFWHVAYHALFYVYLYLQPAVTEKNRLDSWDPRGSLDRAPTGEPLSRDEVLAYLEVCRQEVDEQVAALDLDAPSGFHWLPFSKLELQFYNIRHLQQHTGELCERLGVAAAVDVDWVGSKPA